MTLPPSRSMALPLEGRPALPPDGRLAVVRTPHQAERLLHVGTPVRPLARVVEVLALGSDATIRTASRAEVWVATRAALEDAASLPGPEATAERRAATVAAYDAAIGWLHRCGAPATTGPPTVARIAARVQALLEGAGLVDVRSLPARAARASDSDEPRVLEAAFVDVLGVVPGALEAVHAIEALHAAARRRGGGARLHLPRPRGDDGEGAALADWLERRWADVDDPPELEWITPSAREARAVERIEAPTPTAEAREIASAVVAAIAGGTAPERIAVAVPRSDDPVVRPLLGALADAGVPASREGGDGVLEAPEAAVALELLAMADGRLTRDGLADVLRAPGLHAGGWVGAAHEVDAARIAAQLAHRLREIPVAVDRSGGARLVEAMTSRDAAAGAAIARAVAALRTLGSARGRRAIAAAWSAMIVHLRLGRPSAAEIGAALRAEAASADATSRAAAIRLGTIAASARGVATLVDIVEALASAEARLGLAAPDLAPGDVLAEVRELARAASTSPGGGAPRAGSVRVATPRDLAGLAHDLVVVAGLAASAYAASEVRGLIDEEALRALPAATRPPPLPVRRAAHAMELSWVVDGASRLLLTRRAGLAGGHDEAPHPLFATAAGRDDPPAPRRAPASALLPGSRLSSPREVVLARLATDDLRGAPAVAIAARAADAERTRFFLDPRMPAGAHSGKLAPRDPGAIASRFGGDAPERPVPVTAVERGARCAFAAFASRVLRTRRVEDAVEAATARERGVLVHAALEDAFLAMHAASPDATVAERRALAEQAALRRAGVEAATPLRREAILAAVRDALAIVDLDLATGDAASFRLAEQRFGAGRDAPWGPLRLDAGPGDDGPPIWVDGQIDRIDAPVDGRWVRVVDYKTGKLPRKRDEHVRSLQLALYADAARRFAAGGDPARRVDVAARYVETRRGAARVKDVTVDAEALDTARTSARRVVCALWSGDVAPRAVDGRMCRRCDARDVCRKPAVAATDDEVEGAPSDEATRGEDAR